MHLPPPPPPPEPDPDSDSAPKWPAWGAPLALLVTLVATQVVGTVIFLAAGPPNADSFEDLPPAARIVSLLVQDFGFIAGALVFASLIARPRAWHFGLRPAPWRRSVGWMALVWIAFFVLTAVWIGALGVDERDRLQDELGIDEGPLALVAVTALVTVVAPISEELFFRGYFFSALRTSLGMVRAGLVTGLVFGGIHAFSVAHPAFLLPLAAFGFGLCLLYVRTGSLYPCISLHALNNSLALGVSEDWRWWQVLVVMVAAHAVLAAILLPLGRGAPPRTRPVPALP